MPVDEPLVLDERLAQLLEPSGHDEAVGLVRGYYRPISKGGRFEGRGFDVFEGGVLSDNDPNHLTPEDLIAVQLLHVPMSPGVITALLSTDARKIESVLGRIGLDVVFEDPRAVELFGDHGPVEEAYHELRSIKGVGETTATKILARKRPHLVPIIDRAVRKSLGRKRGHIWQPLQVWIQDSNHARPAELERIRSDARLSNCPSILRIFDVLAWRVGTGKIELPTQV